MVVKDIAACTTDLPSNTLTPLALRPLSKNFKKIQRENAKRTKKLDKATIKTFITEKAATEASPNNAKKAATEAAPETNPADADTNNNQIYNITT